MDDKIASKLRPMRNSESLSTWWLALFAFAAILGITVMNYGDAQDNDMWWLFATGREIIENGIPHMNPFSIWDDQAIVIQQWLPAVIDYVIYDNFGFVGIGIMVFVLSLALAVSAYALARTFSGGRGSEISFVAIALLMCCCSAYLSIRPQVWSMIAYICILIVMETYRKCDDACILLWLPLIVVLHANMHMSMAPFDLIIIGAYVLPDISKTTGEGMLLGYNRLWVMAAVAVCALCLCANPYGIDGALYLLHSYDAAGYGEYISEMNPITIPGKYYGWCMVAFVVLGGISIGKSGRRGSDLPVIVLYLLCVVLSFQYVRNVWLVSIFAFALICSAFAKSSFDSRFAILRDDPPKLIVAAVTCAAVVLFGFYDLTSSLTEEATDSRSTPIAAADYMDDHRPPDGDVNVFVHFNAGGYLEWRGYKVAIDARPELWNDAISHSGQDRYYDYIDMSNGDEAPAEYMDGKSFDYMIVNTDTDLYEYISKSIDYEQMMEGSGYVLFQRKSMRTLNDANEVEASGDVDVVVAQAEDSGEWQLDA